MVALHVSSARPFFMHSMMVFLFLFLLVNGSAVDSISVPHFSASVDSSTLLRIGKYFFCLRSLSMASRSLFLRINYSCSALSQLWVLSGNYMTHICVLWLTSIQDNKLTEGSVTGQRCGILEQS